MSIITVTRNSARHLADTIESVLAQTYKNIEYVIIDGQSTDETLSIIQKYEDVIAYWISEKDSGLYDAMNKGIAHSTGEIVGIVNSDDWLEPDAVAAVVHEFHDNMEAGLVHGNLNARTADGALEAVLCPKLTEAHYYISIPFYHPTCFLRRETYNKYGGFNPKYRIVGDYDLILRLYCNNVKMLYLNRVISNMRAGGASNRPGNFLLTMRESLQTKLDNGLNPILSILGLLAHIFKYKAYEILKLAKLHWMINLYRSMR